jgi:hypothetical protein
VAVSTALISSSPEFGRRRPQLQAHSETLDGRCQLRSDSVRQRRALATASVGDAPCEPRPQLVTPHGAWAEGRAKDRAAPRGIRKDRQLGREADRRGSELKIFEKRTERDPRRALPKIERRQIVRRVVLSPVSTPA